MGRQQKSANERGYVYRWQKGRVQYLADHPLCVYCEQRGKLTPASVVDHIVPHRGDMTLFWDISNWQSLCKKCHDSAKAREERGNASGCDEQGNPIVAGHHWRDG